jgi:hypothetical protein
MKFKTFQALLIGGGAIISGLVIFSIARTVRNQPPESPTITTLDHKPSKPPPRGASPNNANYHDAMLARLGQPSMGETKIKDLLGSGSPKVNVYADAGIWNRAKVDLDRDEKWDEKWRWEADVVYLATAPNDDEAYGPEQIFGEPAPEPKPAASDDGAPTANEINELREVDTLLLELLELPVQTKIKDASKGRSFKINLYSDDGQRFNRAKVDLDRDDKWDEQWTLKADGAIEREVALADDEDYSQRFVLEARIRWQALDPG